MMPEPDIPLALPPADWPEQLAVRIAWFYYGLGMTQQEVAARLGINRARVNRLLAEARRRGVVRITINSRLAENVALEEALAARYGLASARVALAPSDDEAPIAETLGGVGAEALANTLADGLTIGVGWGVTMRALAEAMPERSLPGAAVVAMLGSLTRRSSIAAYEAATTLSQRLDAECFYLPGPLICDSEDSCRAILAQPMMADARERARKADVAIFSVGGLDSGTLRRVGLVDDAEFASVCRAGAIGNFLGHYIDADAQMVDHPLNRRVIGMRPDELRAIRRRVMVSGGTTKLPALAAILRAGLLTEIVTDQASARALVDMP